MAKRRRRESTAGPNADPVSRAEAAIADAVEVAAAAGLHFGSEDLRAQLRLALAMSAEKNPDGPEET